MKQINKVIISIISIFLFSIFWVSTTFAVDYPDLGIGSETAILIEANTGRILYEKDAQKKMYPASTTKIMTAILTLEHVKDLQEIATVSYKAVYSVPAGYSTDLLKVGEELSINELLYALLVKSSNEAANVLAEHIAGSVESFVSMMNTRAVELGCKDTHFVNPNGVHSEEHYSTAYDLSLMAKEAMKNNDFRRYVSTASHTLPSTNKYERTDRNLITTNDLIRSTNKNYYEYAIGIKTGYTSQAKNCLVAGASKDGLELIAVLLGAGKQNSDRLSIRDLDAKNLFEYVYQNFSEKTIIGKEMPVQNIKVSWATKDTKQLDLVAQDEIKALVTNDKVKEENNGEVTIQENIKAPIAKGTVLGTVKYTVDGIEYQTNLIASHDVQKSSIILLILKIALGVFIFLIVVWLLKPKKKKKKRKHKKTKYGNRLY